MGVRNWCGQRGTTAGVILCTWLLHACDAESGSFAIENDRFVVDGKPIQLISGSIHYFRVPHEYWEDRLVRLKAMGLNTVQIYVPWNQHERTPGSYDFDGDLDVTRFLSLAHKVGLWVNLRPGPYICAEWDAGGIPWWFISTKVTGGRDLRLRSEDPAFMAAVDRWWNVLLPKLAPFTRSRGGPILMTQVENEYGYCGSSKPYLRNLIQAVKDTLGKDATVFTTDPPYNVEKGSIAGDEVYTVVDFGPATNPDQAFPVQKRMNPPGKSPPFCSEFYTGWLTHWGQGMANTSAAQMTASFKRILQYANNTGSVNLYMAHGGTNFGFWAGAGLSNTDFLPQITSYDYGAPLSEQGRKGQPGIGGPNKYEMLQQAIAEHTGSPAAEWPQPIPVADHGVVALEESTRLLEAVASLFPGEGIPSTNPVNMEEHDQGHGAILYTTHVTAGSLANGGRLDLGGPVHDFAHIYLDGKLVDYLERSHPRQTMLPATTKAARLGVLVHAMGRDSGGCFLDPKGLITPVTLDGKPLQGWRTFPLPLTVLSSLKFEKTTAPAHSLEHQTLLGRLGAVQADPTFFRGTFNISSQAARGPTRHLADTFLDLKGWGKGVAWVNGFNLGWYWPSIGPQNHYFVPGPRLKEGANEIVLLELESIPASPTVKVVAEPDLRGPGALSALERVTVS